VTIIYLIYKKKFFIKILCLEHKNTNRQFNIEFDQIINKFMEYYHKTI
jgi:hypothetical protein